MFPGYYLRIAFLGTLPSWNSFLWIISLRLIVNFCHLPNISLTAQLHLPVTSSENCHKIMIPILIGKPFLVGLQNSTCNMPDSCFYRTDNFKITSFKRCSQHLKRINYFYFFKILFQPLNWWSGFKIFNFLFKFIKFIFSQFTFNNRIPFYLNKSISFFIIYI